VNSDTLETGEREALASLMDKAMGAASSALTDLLAKRCPLRSAAPSQTVTDKLGKEVRGQQVLTKAKFAEGVMGMNWVLVKDKNAP